MSGSLMIENVSSRQFRVEVLHVREGRSLGRMKQDAAGYYLGMPMAVIGKVSQNRTYYDLASVQDQITNPLSAFRRNLEDGKLYGEYGHPDISEYDPNNPDDKRKMIQRLAKVEETRQSHHFRNIYTDEKILEGGGKLILSDIRPTGPYRSDLKDILDTPTINAAFSLRGIADTVVRDGVMYRIFKRLVTFDYVCSGGYREAAKRYAGNDGALESEGISIDIIRDNNFVVFTEVALENFGDTEIADLFQTSKVSREITTTTVIPHTQAIRKASSTELIDAYQLMMTSRR